MNFNGTFGTHPLIRFEGASLSASKDKFSIGMDVTYAQSDDLEKDGSNSDLGSGKHYTSYEFSLDNQNKLNLTIRIHDGSLSDVGGIDEVVIVRKFIEF